MYIFKHPDFHRDDCSKAVLMKTRRRAASHGSSNAKGTLPRHVDMISSLHPISSIPTEGEFERVSILPVSGKQVWGVVGTGSIDFRGERILQPQDELNGGSVHSGSYYGSYDTELLEGLAEMALTRGVADYVLKQ